ncbi:IS481 family transposase [Phenylobacterium sp. 20VBR1]|uniref:IS481 family transposase n=1 Tax=Phenylobacterium glaciei TaxID=2803784 RepID=A0A941D4R7_9CAUL|nr:IS481 family transposase [Phenylobacterium glaciei]MBR7621867.1 IS481 family transposase [Phenylobacterium glaciei]
MPFTGVSAMDRKQEFVRLALAEGANRRELCRRFGVSSTLAYRLLSRFQAEGRSGLDERSRRPLTSPRQTGETTEAAVLAVRAAHPAWGGRKIAAVLKRQGLAAPAPSTITQILRRHGVELGAFGGGETDFIRFEHAAPNDLWQMDFKGHVAMRSGRLHPLTVLDDHSRFCVVLAACGNEKTKTVQGHLTEAFERYGLPWRMNMDNGSPWGNGPGEPFTPLGVWLIEQDIGIGHSRPYHPQTQGKDERFHRTLKAEAMAGPPFADLDHAARSLDRWRGVYNTERPHEALGLRPPIDRYTTSPRSYRSAVEPFEYGPDDQPRRVPPNDSRISFKGRTWRIPKAFGGKIVAIRPTPTDGLYDVVFRTLRIAAIDLRTKGGQSQPVTDVPEQVSPMSPV